MRVSTEGLSAESLMLNMAVQKLPDHLKRNVQTELSHLQPNFHLTQEQYCKAFDRVTNRLDKNDEVKVVSTYSNFTSKTDDVENEDGEQFCNIHWSYEKECVLNTPKEVREYLIANDRCIKCGEPKNRHGEYCKWMRYPCPKHKEVKIFHVPETCEGENYHHPGCQFNFNDR